MGVCGDASDIDSDAKLVAILRIDPAGFGSQAFAFCEITRNLSTQAE